MSDSCSDTLRTPAAPSFTQPCSPDENLTGTFLPPVAGSTKEKRWKAAMEKRDVLWFAASSLLAPPAPSLLARVRVKMKAAVCCG
ncbi:hypothetical protein LXL04_035626 [Taraxacum kok-saghyz]